jgi:small-conductance mechanosensitive channel
MSALQKIAAAVLIALLAAAAYGLWATNQSAAPVRALRATAQAPAGATPLIDENTYLTAKRLARLASTAEEQPLAQAAVQTADHELDLAFAAAMRHLEAHPPTLSPEASQIQQRLQDAQKVLASDSEDLKRLTAQLAKASDADKPAIQDRLDLAQSQLELQQDEVQEANEDLLQAGGNLHQRIQTMQQEHQATERNADAAPAVPAVSPLGMLHGLVGQVREWLSLQRKRRWLSEARGQASASAAQLVAERQRLMAELEASKTELPALAAQGGRAKGAGAASAGATPGTAMSARPALPAPAPAPASAASAPAAAAAGAQEPETLLSVTRRIAADQHRITLRDQRINARRRLAEIYGQWNTVVAGQARAVLHDTLVGATVVVTALLLLLFANGWIDRLLARAPIDRRQLATLRSVVGVALQIVGVLVILLVLVGLPGQLATMLGIVGAGLTVALKDFIVAFIGWFVLMGRNGMRVGDWVEINGVSGEVVELNMFHTVLLETGNWTDAGHPTGRRVTFTNSFAIGGHYFNFSTSGQWLWDELSVVVPYDRDPHAVAAAIQKEVTAATEKDAQQAEQEWRRASRGQRGVAFSVQPGIAVRPAAGGVEIAVRYVTRASERLALRAKLYQSAVQLLAAHS